MLLSVGTGQTEWNARTRLKLPLDLFIETYSIRKQMLSRYLIGLYDSQLYEKHHSFVKKSRGVFPRFTWCVMTSSFNVI